MGDKTINLVDIDGVARPVPESEVQYRLDRGWHLETAREVAGRATEAAEEEMYGGIGGAASATAGGVLRGATLGLSDVVATAAGGEDERRYLAGLREHNQLPSLGGEVIGGIVGLKLPGMPAGLASRAGTAASRTAEGAGTLAQIGAAARGAAAEGAIQGAGQGVTELALSEDPLSLERAISVIGSNGLMGAGVGGVVGGAGKGVEVGLRRAKTALDDIAGRGVGHLGEAEDLAKLDAKGLRAAHKTELEAVEAARVPQRAEVADEIRALRAEMKEKKLWLATKDADVKAIKEVREIGKISLEADKAIDRMLRNPKALAKRPERVLDGLQQQEHALEVLVGHGDNLRPIFAADSSGARAAALDYASTALEKNRALQAKLGELTGKPASARLDEITDRLAGLGQAQAKTPGVFGSIGDAAGGYALGAMSGIPFLGEAIAIGRVAAPLIKKLGVHSAEVAARGSKAVGALLDVTRKVTPAAPVLATKVLGSVRYAMSQDEKPARPAKGSRPAALADVYRARSSELRSHIETAPDGKPQVRMATRRKIAAQLAPIAAADPIAADRLETIAVRRLEYQASKIPRRPDLAGMQMGPDRWQPSDMEMRAFARHVAASEDPTGAVERLADGSITPEDVEAMSTVYPEMYADIQRQIMEQLGELRAQLPYQRRLALSIFSGVPVDPSLDPRVLAALQRTFASEPGTEGGTQAPAASPQFGSVTKPSPTPAQERGG